MVMNRPFNDTISQGGFTAVPRTKKKDTVEKVREEIPLMSGGNG